MRATSQRLGGPLGRRADTVGSWWTPARWVLLTATVVYLLGVLFRLPCRITVAGQSPDSFRWMCYSDIGILYQLRGLMQGNVPYLDSGSYPVLEYPVLTGWFLQLERVISTALGAPTGSELTAQQQVDSTLIFTDVNIVILGALLLVTVWAQVGSVPHRPWDAMMLAASPCVAATALINWDLLPVALTAVGVLFWARRRPGWAGLFWGLGMAAKLYPLFLLGPLLFLCLRAGRMREFGRMLAAFAVAWLVMNLPALWLAPDNWLSFWTFNSDRSGDLGSIWYVLSLAGHPVDGLNSLALADLRADVRRDRRPDPGRSPPAADRAGDVPGDRRLPADQQGLLPAVRAVAAAVRGAGPPRVAGLADLHRRRARLLRRHLVASRRSARPGRRRSGQGLLARGDRPDGSPSCGSWRSSSGTSGGRRTTSYAIRPGCRRPSTTRPAACWTGLRTWTGCRSAAPAGNFHPRMPCRAHLPGW